MGNISSGSGNTLGLNSVATSFIGVLNITGSNGYNLSVGSLSTQGNALTINPTTANVAVATLDLGRLGYNCNLTLSGSSTGNTIGSILSSGAGGGDTPLSNAVTISGGGWTLTGTSTYTEPTLISGGSLVLGTASSIPNSTFVVNANNGLLFGPGAVAVGVGGLSGSGNVALATTDASPKAVALSVGSNGPATPTAAPSAAPARWPSSATARSCLPTATPTRAAPRSTAACSSWPTPPVRPSAPAP